MVKPKMLDLFSGIGGFSIAFKSVFDTIGYCEINQYCRDILGENIRRGHLKDAPIHHDIKSLHRSSLTEIPTILSGGFPCQDISTANVKSIGISGNRSTLFHEIVRISIEIPEIQHSIMENVPRLVNMGMDTVVDELSKLGFEVKYVYISARQLGAHHNRKRVVIIATKSIENLREISKDLIQYSFSWGDNVDRVIECKDRNIRSEIRKRCGACGNAIVPYCIVKAFNNIVFSMEIPDESVKLDLMLIDGCITYPKQVWATPCAAPRTYYKYKKLSKRSTTLLYNQIFFERGTLESVETHTINPEFVEWLMGYPLGYTKLPGQ